MQRHVGRLRVFLPHFYHKRNFIVLVSFLTLVCPCSVRSTSKATRKDGNWQKFTLKTNNQTEKKRDSFCRKKGFLFLFLYNDNHQVKTWPVSGESGLKVKMLAQKILYADGLLKKTITVFQSLLIRCLHGCAEKNHADTIHRLVYRSRS